MKDFNRYRFFNAGNKVIAVSSYAGQTVKGTAKCSTNDTFDARVGRELAATRCWNKIASRRYANLARKHEVAMRDFNEAQKRLMKITEYLREAGVEKSEAERYLESLESSLKGNSAG